MDNHVSMLKNNITTITIDYEDFGQLYYKYRCHEILPPGKDIDRQTKIILDLMANTETVGTFFVLGMLARYRPDLIKYIHKAGHEIAIHGMAHEHLTLLDCNSIKKDIGQSIDVVSDIIGEQIKGYRAPFFSILKQNLWVLEILAELGIDYDSSIFPMALPRYGIPNFDPEPRYYKLPGEKSIVELPLTIIPWVGRNYPIAGGGYMRLIPKFLLGNISKCLQNLDRPFIIYMHPYEFDTNAIDVASSFPASDSFPVFDRLCLNFKWNLFRSTIRGKIKYLSRQLHTMTCLEICNLVKKTQCPIPLEQAF